jgi:hypothetical protein
MQHIKNSLGSILSSLIIFIKSSLQEISPWNNIKFLHKNIKEDIVNREKTRNIKIFISNAELHIKKVLEDLQFIEHIGKQKIC